MPTPQTNPTCLSLHMDEEAKKEIEAMLVRTQVPTVAALIKRSLVLFDVIHEHEKSGGTVIFRHANGGEEQIKIL